TISHSDDLVLGCLIIPSNLLTQSNRPHGDEVVAVQAIVPHASVRSAGMVGQYGRLVEKYVLVHTNLNRVNCSFRHHCNGATDDHNLAGREVSQCYNSSPLRWGIPYGHAVIVNKRNHNNSIHTKDVLVQGPRTVYESTGTS